MHIEGVCDICLLKPQIESTATDVITDRFRPFGIK
jgi:hypothetical protein